MPLRSAFRAASAIALVALLVACGDKNLLTDPGQSDFRGPTPQLNAVELLITIIGSGGSETTGPNPPSFSLSSVPTAVDARTTWSRTIAVDPNGPFGPDMAVDYGDGAGPQNLKVTKIGDAYSFTLSRTYAAAGTYTVTVVAATYADYESSRFAEATITVAPDPRLYIENFQMASQVIQGQSAPFSFDAAGPAGAAYTVTMTYGTSLTQTSSVPANGTYSSSFAWAEPGTYEVSATISNGDRSATHTHTVVVEPRPIVIESFVGPANVSFGEEAAFSFQATGPSGTYSAKITYGDGSEPTVLPITQGTTIKGTHTWANSGLWKLTIVVSNEFVADTLIDSIAIYRPRPTVDDVSIPSTLHFGQESEIRFVPNDVTAVEAMEYQIAISDGSQSSDLNGPATPGEPIVFPITAPDQNGVFEIRIVALTLLNGLVLFSDTAVHTLTVEDLVCTAGSYRDGFACVDSPPGSYVPVDGAFEAVPCPIGTYQDRAGQTSCIPAPVGTYVPAPGATQAQLCPVGTYQDQTGSSACKPAAPGHFVSHAGASQATPCAPGTYQPAAGSGSCTQAAPGSYVSTYGATQATACAPGTYQPASGQTGCNDAPVGSYVDVSGAAAPTLCPATTSTTGTGSTSAAQCIPLGQIAVFEIEAAVSEGTLVAASAGAGGTQQFDTWVASLSRAFEFLERSQLQAGCSAVRNALTQADGNPSPPDVVSGPARAAVEAVLREILAEYGC